MREKIYIIVSILICMLGLTSCTSKSKYSEEETTVIADYVAQTVIKHSEGYEGKLIDISDNPFLVEEEDDFIDSLREDSSDVELAINDEEVNKDEPTVKTGTSEDTRQTTEIDSRESDDGLVEVTPKETSKVLGLKEGLETCINTYEVLEEYASSSYVIDVKDNEKLIKVVFEIKNVTDKDMGVKVDSNSIKVNLVSDEDTYYPLLTAIENDLMYLDKNIKAGKTQKAIVIYKVPKTLDEKKVRLEIKNNSQKESIFLEL